MSAPRTISCFLAVWASVFLVFMVAGVVLQPTVPIGYVVIVAIIDAIYVALIGLPAYWTIKGLKLNSAIAYTVTGLVCSVPAAVALGFLLDPAMSAFSLLAGSIAGCSFWLVRSAAQQGAPGDAPRPAGSARA